MCKANFMPIGAGTFTVQVQQYQNGEMSGLVYGPTLAQAVPFSSLTGLVLMIDGCLDTESSILPAQPVATNCIATLELDILFRQNHSWQGNLRWLDAHKESPFRSVLELLFLFDTILGE